MPSPPVRRFTIFDGMFLIAATAVGIAWARVPLNEIRGNNSIPATFWDGYELLAEDLSTTGFPILLTWTVAILILRFLPPRPQRRHLTRQPGFIACLMITLTTAIVGLVVGILLLVVGVSTISVAGSRSDILPRVWFNLAVLFTAIAPVFQTGLLCSWLTLWLSGRWRAERSWIDRAGRLLGIVWLIGLPIMAVFWLTELAYGLF